MNGSGSARADGIRPLAMLLRVWLISAGSWGCIDSGFSAAWGENDAAAGAGIDEGVCVPAGDPATEETFPAAATVWGLTATVVSIALSSPGDVTISDAI